MSVRVEQIVMRVILIVSDQRYSSHLPFPPVGTTGTVIAGLDEDGEYEVLFDDWPIVSPVDPGWFVHKSMIVFLDDDAQTSINENGAVLCA